MTTAQLAGRLGVAQSTLVEIEQSEAKGTIQLSTLRRVAQGLECRLVYALVPDETLESIVRSRARAFAGSRRAPIEHSMLLENQGVTEEDAEEKIDQLIRDTNPRMFWD